MKIKANRFMWATSVFLIFFLVSCAANLELRKRQEEALRNFGEAYIREGDYTKALRKLLEAEKLYAEDPHLQYDLGLVYMAKENPGMAIDHFKKAVEIKPDYTPAKNSLGAAYLAEKKWDDAISCFKEISGDLLYVTPHYPLSNLGWAYYNKKKYDLAEKYYQDALKIEPRFAIALSGLGKTYIAAGKIPESVVIFEKAVKISPSSAELYLDLADTYRLSREYKKALNAYKKVIELAPDSPLAVDAQKEIEGLRNWGIK
ncbi:MAG: tetratricopeptide repeat protein [Desulfobacterales bacterium]|uniref:Tetratricopeptide repeat protein n=1 Tax=Candidatus Desulfaltia bathyphila TaxID=2841697 RepID=A0A8J6T8G9_9BACT|nr:tetratricopeptide repeat protein [Candidatus Desulfaltia bathyphila]MBL7195673.1 tetratricopeptide repeat protein [Desulfobacterales bacterium]MBL7207146.1 tetratricopeptide repeat protein [Desulfobacterales bacterium]